MERVDISRFYRANKKLKQIGVQIEFTAEQLDEYKRCAKDPIYFINKYAKVVHPDKGLVNCELYPYQEKMINLFDSERFVITKAARQCGKCVSGDTRVWIRNKITGQILMKKISDLLDTKYSLTEGDHEPELNPPADGSSPQSTYRIDILKKIKDWEVRNDIGWANASAIVQTHPMQEWRVRVDSGDVLHCADNHLLFDRTGNEVYVRELRPGDYVKTMGGMSRIVSVTKTENFIPMFDLILTDATHRYYTNTFLSHNSTATVMYFLWYALFHPMCKLGIFAQREKTAIELLGKIKLAYENLPLWIQQGVVAWGRKSIELENGTIIDVGATSTAGSRGSSYRIILLDEFAIIPETIADEFFKSTFPTISAGKTTKVFISSTPKGMNHFYKKWREAETKKGFFVPISVSWQDVPGRDEEWHERELSILGDEGFSQEHECEFIGSSDTLIKSTKLRALPIGSRISGDEFLNVYDLPDPARTYMVTVDSARGVGGDYSAASVFDITETPFKQVAIYRNNKISHLVYPDVLVDLGRRYNDAPILIERNSPGDQVASILRDDIGYDNVITFDDTIGVLTTKSTKRSGCLTLKTMVENDQLFVPDANTIFELSNFSRRKDSYEAASGHDDTVMTLVLFSWFTTHPQFQEWSDASIRGALSKKIAEAKIEESVVPFGFVSDGDDKKMDWFEPDDVDFWDFN